MTTLELYTKVLDGAMWKVYGRRGAYLMSHLLSTRLF